MKAIDIVNMALNEIKEKEVTEAKEIIEMSLTTGVGTADYARKARKWLDRPTQKRASGL